MSELPDAIVAGCALLGLLGTGVGLAYGYGVFKGHLRASLDSQRAATKALHERLDFCDSRLDRLERISQELREVFIREGMMVPSGTQGGVPNPLHPLHRRD